MKSPGRQQLTNEATPKETIDQRSHPEENNWSMKPLRKEKNNWWAKAPGSEYFFSRFSTGHGSEENRREKKRERLCGWERPVMASGASRITIINFSLGSSEKCEIKGFQHLDDNKRLSRGRIWTWLREAFAIKLKGTREEFVLVYNILVSFGVTPWFKERKLEQMRRQVD